MTTDSVKALLAAVASGRDLARAEAEHLFDLLLSGDATPAQIGAILVGMRVRGETVDEIAGAVTAMRRQMLTVEAPAGAIDLVGTGGDGHGTLNVSTLSAIIVAACGVPVAKHGNRAASSRSGSSDVLAALGVETDGPAARCEACLAEAGLCFMSAQAFHPSMRRVAAVRAELGTRTLFNLLGPLSNPAGVKRLLVGVFAETWLEPLARVLGSLGAEHVWLVHGRDGLDEITTTSETAVVEWRGGAVQHLTLTPEEFGLTRTSLQALKGGSAQQNAAALEAVLAGAHGAYRDIGCFNAAAGLVIAGAAPDVAHGLAMACDALDSGRAAAVLRNLVSASKRSLVAVAG